MKRKTTILALAILGGLLGGIVASIVFAPGTAIYVPFLAVGLALALQKYTASFFAFFVIRGSHIFDLGDRIRIGNVKGDVRQIGLLHFALEEVGEDEKLGGELTGRILRVPNLVVLDQAVLNYSKDYSVHHTAITSDYIFDEIRVPLTTSSNIEQGVKLLEGILRTRDARFVAEARQLFQDGYPEFLDEAEAGPRVLVSVEPQRIWVKGKFVTPVKERNEVRTGILMEFLKSIGNADNIKLA